MPRRLSLAAALVLALAAAPLLAEPPEWTAFRNGIRAYASKQYATAAAELRKAIAANPSESRDGVLIYGTWYEPYAPHLRLAMALAKLGRCDDARSEFAASDSQRVAAAAARNIRDYGTVKAIRDACGPPPPPPRAVTASADKPPVTATVVTETRGPQPPVTSTAVATTTQPPVAVPVGGDVTAAKRGLQAAIDEARRALGATMPSAARAARTKLAAAVDSAGRSLPATNAAALAQATTALTASIDDYRNAVASLMPPPSLIQAIRAYQGGDYGRALALLSSTSSSNSVYRAQIALFSAAAHHAEFLLAGARDAALKSAAIADVKRYRSFDRSEPIDRRLFSPQFIDFVAQTR